YFASEGDSTMFPARITKVLLIVLTLLVALVILSRTSLLASPSVSVSASSQAQDHRAPDSPEILWDTWGVPHIYGNDTQELFYAFGWAQMQSHGDLLLQLYGEARGRAAEYWGEQYLPSDRWIRTLGVPARARAWYAAQTPAFRSYLDAFAAGINAYAREHPAALDADVAA